MEEDRPVHAVMDCRLGQVQYVPLTDEEWADHGRRVTESEAAQVAAHAAAADLKARVAAHPDPLVRVLAGMAGIA